MMIWKWVMTGNNQRRRGRSRKVKDGVINKGGEKGDSGRGNIARGENGFVL